MYSIRNATAKGIGVFATTRIPRGTRLLAERPLFTVKAEREAYPAVRRLTATDRAWFNGLTTSGSQRQSIVSWAATAWNVARSGCSLTALAVAEYRTIVPVFRNNNFDIGNGTQAMFRDISRINHSCRPNCQGNFNETIDKFTIHAIQPIAPDEEITISYLDEHTAPTESRQSQLRQRYGFDCDCSLCDLASAAARESEQRRIHLHEKLNQHARLTSLSGKGSEQTEMELLMDMIRMFEDEQVAGRELATLYLTAAERYLHLGNEHEAHRYADLGLGTELSCLGDDNPFYLESVERMKPVLQHKLD